MRSAPARQVRASEGHRRHFNNCLLPRDRAHHRERVELGTGDAVERLRVLSEVGCRPVMLLTIALCVLLVVASTLVHYEILGQLSSRLPDFVIPSRLKLVVVMIAVFAAHAGEVLLYAAATWAWISTVGIGGLAGTAAATFANCLYFSAETYTSLGFGDIVPSGPLRLLAGVETLNGLLLIGWSSSFIYLSMERFWDVAPAAKP